ncbi:hypothetical protein M8818_003885 [Zalaria obscura]|uniref:Uncharacterized protein n=1 Tax=Zalaria obscura TaxID=2024903 RepID=A0ACC3SGS3_9PEZI
MQSSPPVRAYSPASPVQSQYSLDLNALTLDDHSEPSSPLPQQHLDRVLSEDIDGPSDFTINMEKWMRGTLRKKDAWNFKKLNEVEEQSVPAEKEEAQEVKENMQEWIEEEDAGSEATVDHKQYGTEERDFETSTENRDDEDVSTVGAEQQNDGTMSPNSSLINEANMLSLSGPTANDSMDEQSQQQQPRDSAQPEDSSVWDPYATTSTPQSVKHNKNFLQPTVEDYYSELTPARPMSAHKPSQNQEPSALSRNFTPGRPSSPTIYPEQSPAPQMQPSAVNAESGDFTQLEQELEQARRERQEALQESEDLRTQLSSERSALERRKNELVDLDNHIRTLTNTAQNDAQRHEQEMADMKRQLQQACDTANHLHEELADLRSQLQLAQECRNDAGELEAENTNLRVQLQEARSAQQQAEEHASAKEREIDQMRESEDAELHDLGVQLKDSQSREKKLREVLSEKESLLADLSEEKDRLVEQVLSAQNAEQEAEEKAWQLREELSEAEEREEKQNSLVTGALEEKDAVKRELQVLRKQAEESAEAQRLLRGELEETRAAFEAKKLEIAISHDTSVDVGPDVLATLAQREQEWTSQRSDLNSQLEALRKELLTTHTQHTTTLETLHAERRARHRAEAELQSLKTGQSAMDGLKQQLEELRSAKTHSEKLSEALNTRLQLLQRCVDEQREELGSARQAPAPVSASAQQMDKEALEALGRERERADVLVTELDRLRIELEASRRDAAGSRAELEDVRAAQEEVNAALDARVADVLSRREKKWKGRMAEMERERDVMSKALMQAWGREELGKGPGKGLGDEQRYGYRFAKA